jgi:hypothetical protein
MAPSIIEGPVTGLVAPLKSDTEASGTPPKIRRIIDEEGGTTTASVCHDDLFKRFHSQLIRKMI